MKDKSDAINHFKKFKMKVKNKIGNIMHVLRTNRGNEFTSHEFGNPCEDHGMMRHLTTPYTRKKWCCRKAKMTLLERTQRMLKEKQVPIYFLGEVVHLATHIINQIVTMKIIYITRYELYYNRNPNIA